MPKKFTTEEWIEACREKRPDFEDYDFSKVEYINADTKVLIIHKDFPEHPWEVIPPNFKDKGRSHPMISGTYRWTTEEWIEACRKKRPDFYDYDFSKVEYVDTRTKVLIKHKEFPEYRWEVMPNCFKDRGISHPMISGTYRWTTEEWIQDCKAKRPDFDDYIFDYVEYVDSRTKVLIKHKDFPQNDWYVYPKQFKDRGDSHPLLYKRGYSRTDFKNYCIKNNKGKGFLYLIYFICKTSGEKFTKIGITSRTVKERFCGMKYNHLKIKKTVLLEQEPDLIYDLENEILREYRHYKFNPTITFKGQTECFTSDAWPIILKEKLAKYLIT